MFSETIKQELHRRVDRMATGHPAVKQAKEGKVGANQVANYLASLHFLFSQTIPHMERAKARSVHLGLVGLVPFFERKLVEEVGHEKWAEDDLRELVRHSGAVLGRPLPATVELVKYLTDLIESDPRLYIVYAVCTEYFTVLAGPVWIQALTENCGVPRAALTAASKHVEADQEHAVHGFAEIDELITDPALGPAVADTVDRTMRLFDQLFREVVAAPN